MIAGEQGGRKRGDRAGALRGAAQTAGPCAEGERRVGLGWARCRRIPWARRAGSRDPGGSEWVRGGAIGGGGGCQTGQAKGTGHARPVPPGRCALEAGWPCGGAGITSADLPADAGVRIERTPAQSATIAKGDQRRCRAVAPLDLPMHLPATSKIRLMERRNSQQAHAHQAVTSTTSIALQAPRPASSIEGRRQSG